MMHRRKLKAEGQYVHLAKVADFEVSLRARLISSEVFGCISCAFISAVSLWVEWSRAMVAATKGGVSAVRLKSSRQLWGDV